MSTLCQCGHAKSQHPNGVCDYSGYSCQCNGYKKQGTAGPSFNERLADMRKRMDSDPMFELMARQTGMSGLADELRKAADDMMAKIERNKRGK